MDKFKEYLKIAKEKFDVCLKASTDKINDLKSKSQKNEPKSKNTKAPNKKVQKKAKQNLWFLLSIVKKMLE